METVDNEVLQALSARKSVRVYTDEPVTEGLVSLLEPFIDTVVICTMTALVIILTDASNEFPQYVFLDCLEPNMLNTNQTIRIYLIILIF